MRTEELEGKLMEFHCPTCKGPLRKMSYDELREGVKRRGLVEDKYLDLMMPVATGPYAWWWCAACEKRVSSMQLMSQVVTVTPLDEAQQEQG